MSNDPSTYNDEIDLIKLIETVWVGKWKILSIMTVSLLSVIGFNIIKPNIYFTATTHIKPITSVEFDKYRLFNSTSIFEVKKDSLLDLYIENIEEGSLLEIGIDKYNLINKDEFENDTDYKEAIEKFASEIKVLRPIHNKNDKRLHHVLIAKYDNKNKWKKLIAFVNKEVNRKVKLSIANRFNTIVSVENQKKYFTIKDIDIQIDNVKKDYERKTKDRLAFLAEQASIARKLEIPKNTIAFQRFNSKNTVVTNVKTNSPFYLRGYLAIEHEISLIKGRENKTSFIKDLLSLEQKKRTIVQNNSIKRAVELFNKTPLNQNDFKATMVKVATTDFKRENKIFLYCLLALVLGSIIGVIYVLIANAFQTRKMIK